MTSRISKWSATAATGRLSASRTSIDDLRRVGQQRAAPAARAERRERRQRHQRRIERQDRAVGGKVVGGRAGRRRHQHAVGDQLAEPRRLVDLDAQLGRLVGLAPERHLVDRPRGRLLPSDVARPHQQRMDDRRQRRREPVPQARARNIRSSGSRPSRGSCRRSAWARSSCDAASAASGRRRRGRR